MNRDDLLAEVTRAMSDMFEIDPTSIKLETRLFEDLGLDSIDAIDMAVKMQEMTGQRIDEASLRKIRTVGDVVSLLETLEAKKSAGGGEAQR